MLQVVLTLSVTGCLHSATYSMNIVAVCFLTPSVLQTVSPSLRACYPTIYRNIILPLSLCWCETWSFTLREEHRLRVFENGALRNIIVPKRDEAIGDWRKFHSEELHDLFSSPNITRVIKSRRMRLAEHVERIGGRIVAYSVWMGKPGDRGNLEDTRLNIRIILKWIFKN